MSKLKKTLFVGGLLGAGLVWLTSSKKGKEMRDKMLDAAADIYVDVSKKLKKFGAKYNASKEDYMALVEESVDKYVKKHPMLAVAKDMIVKIVVSQWENMKENVGEKVQETKRAAKSAVKKTTVKKK